MSTQYPRVYAAVDLDAAVYNMEQMKKLIKPDCKMMAVIKTDGYGHGAIPLAHKLEPLDYLFGFAVATVEEAVSLREAGITKPILILGYIFPEQYEILLANDIRATIFDMNSALELSKLAQKMNVTANIHIKIDTGMGRIGYQVNEESANEIAQISRLPHMMVEGIFTHFAKADETDKTHVHMQLELFRKMINDLQERGVEIPMKHCSNSAGIIDLPEANMDMVRAGITLYGLWPSDEVHKERILLKPLMSVKSRVVHVKTLPKGCSISYGGTYTTDKTTVVATIPVGYGDGYARSLSNKGDVIIKGKRAPILGRVCMDQFMVDVTHIEGVQVGDVVTLLGSDGEETITMEELGNRSGRFNYEFVCDMGKRIPRVYD